jgi:hypothetical protein
MGMWTGFVWFSIFPVAVFCEHGHEPSGPLMSWQRISYISELGALRSTSLRVVSYRMFKWCHRFICNLIVGITWAWQLGVVDVHSFVVRNAVYWPVALNGSLLTLTEANWATYVMRVGIEAIVFTGCTGFSLGKSLVTLRKKIRFARMFAQRLGGHFYLTDVGFGSRRGFSLACPVQAHSPVRCLGINRKLFF